MPTNTPTALSPVAEAVARAQQTLSQHEQAYQAAAEHLEKVKKRVDTLAAERQQIISARAHGPQTHEQESRLAVLSADLEGLQPLLEDAQAAVAQADTAPYRARLASAETAFQLAQDEITYNALSERVKALEAVLCGAIGELYLIGKRLGRPHLSLNWRPSTELGRAIHYGIPPAPPAKGNG